MSSQEKLVVVHISAVGDQRLELRDDQVTNLGGTFPVRVGSEDIGGSQVIITGTEDTSTFTINSIAVNMTAEDDYYVGRGEVLSNVIRAAGDEQELLFTNNWNIRLNDFNITTNRGTLEIGRLCPAAAPSPLSCTGGPYEIVCGPDLGCRDSDIFDDINRQGVVTVPATGFTQTDSCSADLLQVQQVNCGSNSATGTWTYNENCPIGTGCRDGICVYIPSAEICDNLDNNANYLIDEGCDDDWDDYCDVSMTIIGTPTTCPNGGGDCADHYIYADADGRSINPGVTERCSDYDDNNCDGRVNEGCAPSVCSDESGDDVTRGSTVEIYYATGFGTLFPDYCDSTHFINETSCSAESSFLPISTRLPCPPETTCTDSDSRWGLPAVCS